MNQTNTKSFMKIAWESGVSARSFQHSNIAPDIIDFLIKKNPPTSKNKSGFIYKGGQIWSLHMYKYALDLQLTAVLQRNVFAGLRYRYSAHDPSSFRATVIES